MDTLVSSLSISLSLSLCVQEFHLKDVESVKKAVRFSNVVVNLIGRDYETRCTNKQTHTHLPSPLSLSLSAGTSSSGRCRRKEQG